LFAVCEKLARQVVVRNGGRIEKGANGEERFMIPVRKTTPDAFTPSWSAPAPTGSRFTEEEMAKQRFALRLPYPEEVADPDPTVRVQKTLDALFPGWKTSENAPAMKPGLVAYVRVAPDQSIIYGLVKTHPPKPGVPVTLSRSLKVPYGDPKLHFDVLNSPGGDFKLVVRVNGETIRSDYSLVIMGDVREGGRVVAAGSIFVLGCLFGEAGAGVTKNSYSHRSYWLLRGAAYRNLFVNPIITHKVIKSTTYLGFLPKPPLGGNFIIITYFH
jgi:hypothetical protein